MAHNMDGSWHPTRLGWQVDRCSENLWTSDVNAVPIIVALVWSFCNLPAQLFVLWCEWLSVRCSRLTGRCKALYISLIFSFGFFTLDFTVIDGNASVISIGKTLDLGQLFSCELETGLLVSRDGTRASWGLTSLLEGQIPVFKGILFFIEKLYLNSGFNVR
jgi:hypothetical protein